MVYTHQRWPGVIGLDLSKQTCSGGEGYTRRRNFTGKMTQDESGYVRLLDEICTDDLVIMEAGNSSQDRLRTSEESSTPELTCSLFNWQKSSSNSFKSV